MADEAETTIDLEALRAGREPGSSVPEVRLSGRLVGKDAERFDALVRRRGLGPSKVVQSAVVRFLDELESEVKAAA